jgi:hypothetical protein
LTDEVSGERRKHPDELIRALIAGAATFLYGAGVSNRAGLPRFGGLIDRIYKRLGGTPDNEPAERRAIDGEEYGIIVLSLGISSRLGFSLFSSDIDAHPKPGGAAPFRSFWAPFPSAGSP